MTTFDLGSRVTYELLHENPTADFAPVHYVNDSSLIVKNPPMVLINAVAQLDRRGQSDADTTGARRDTSVARHTDFVEGLSISLGHTPLICP